MVIRHVRIVLADGGPRVRRVISERSATVTVYLRAGQPVDAFLCDALEQISRETRPVLADRPPLSYGEAAAALGVSTKWLQRRVKEGSIPYTMVGKRVRFLPEHVYEIKQARVRRSEQ